MGKRSATKRKAYIARQKRKIQEIKRKQKIISQVMSRLLDSLPRLHPATDKN